MSADQSVLKDKEAKFECAVKSNPKTNIVWLLNGKKFTKREGVRIEKGVGKDKYWNALKPILLYGYGNNLSGHAAPTPISTFWF